MRCAIHLLWGSLGEWRTAGLEQGTILGLAHRLDLATDRNKGRAVINATFFIVDSIA
jgi:hypothetical protein